MILSDQKIKHFEWSRVYEYDCIKNIVIPKSDSPDADSCLKYFETVIAQLETLKGNGTSSWSFFTTPATTPAVTLFSVTTATVAAGAIAAGVLAALGIAAAITTPVGIALGAAAALAIIALVCKLVMDHRENKAPVVTTPAHP